MKKHTIIATMFLLISVEIKAQKMVAKTYVEKIHSGYKIGTAIGHETYSQIELGVFYQIAQGGQTSESHTAVVGAIGKFEREFAGIYTAIPIQYSDEVDIKVQLRTGIINRENFVATPSLLAHYKPVSQMRFGFGIGFRSLVPTLQASFSYGF